MQICKKCGSKVYDGLDASPNCGTPVTDQEPGNTPGTQPAPAPAPAPAQSEFMDKVSKLNETPDTTGDYSAEDIQQNKVMGVLAYLGWLVLIPLFAAKNSPFARFHTNQGLVLAIVSIIWGVVTGIVSSIIPFLGALLSLVSLVFLALAIIGIVNVVNGKAKELPVLGKYRILK